jgi:hypothetical protein
MPDMRAMRKIDEPAPAAAPAPAPAPTPAPSPADGSAVPSGQVKIQSGLLYLTAGVSVYNNSSLFDTPLFTDLIVAT